jgi:Collagen triple helix repeat (20 copies)
MKRLAGSLSPAMIVALLALFVALSGTAVATTSAVITGRQIANNSITGLDVRNKSLTPLDFRGSLRGPAGPRGAQGAQGAQGVQGSHGAQGPKGDKGDPGATSLAVRFADETSPNPNDTQSAFCVGSERATGGGYWVQAGDPKVTVTEPSGSPPTGWRVQWDRVGVTSVTIRVWVVCAQP